MWSMWRWPTWAKNGSRAIPLRVRIGAQMARNNYSYEKRQRELAKKRKKEEKRKRKAEAAGQQEPESSPQPLDGESAGA